MEPNVADKAFVKRWPDGRPVIVTQLTETEARVKIGDEYQVLPIEQWRQLPLWKYRDVFAR
jgi:hypothetical protein